MAQHRSNSSAFGVLVLLVAAALLSGHSFVPAPSAPPRVTLEPAAAAALGVVPAVFMEMAPAFARGAQTTRESMYDGNTEAPPSPESIFFNLALFGGLVAFCLPIVRLGLSGKQ